MSPQVGLAQTFSPGQQEQVEQFLADLEALEVRTVRTAISWAEWVTPEGRGFYEWLIRRLGRELELVVCLGHTPPPLGLAPRTASPPGSAAAFADFVDELVARLGDSFEWLEPWGAPDRPDLWDRRLDPDWSALTAMLTLAAGRARARGKRIVLPAAAPTDAGWLRAAAGSGLLAQVDAVGLRGEPGTLQPGTEGWDELASRVRALLERSGREAPLWLVEAGYSTWRRDERAQAEAFSAALDAPVERLYWASWRDAGDERSFEDPRQAHFGLRRCDGPPKLLHRLWASGGPGAAREAQWMTERRVRPEPHVLITGGAGFIGTNLADRLLREGTPVLVYDDLSRPGVERNLSWLRQEHGDRLRVEIADVRDRAPLHWAVERASAVYHFAAQVAVTTSLTAPGDDFDVNARGTLELLEAVRARGEAVPVVFTSTNKVYGALEDVELVEGRSRYQPSSPVLRRSGIGEERALQFHSPYGCSKGAADQYVLDYARTFGLSATVFRMSCIYGPHQFGNEDQGWLAHFLISALEGRPVTIYGDGKQVRDVLFVDDLVEAFLLARQHIGRLSGEAFNVGGGPQHTISLLELLERIEALCGEPPEVRFDGWRPADQRYYVSDCHRLKLLTGWWPRVDVVTGLVRLRDWLLESRGIAVPQRAAGEAGR